MGVDVLVGVTDGVCVRLGEKPGGQVWLRVGVAVAEDETVDDAEVVCEVVCEAVPVGAGVFMTVILFVRVAECVSVLVAGTVDVGAGVEVETDVGVGVFGFLLLVVHEPAPATIAASAAAATAAGHPCKPRGWLRIRLNVHCLIATKWGTEPTGTVATIVFEEVEITVTLPVEPKLVT